jgi:hypothetical protein
MGLAITGAAGARSPTFKNHVERNARANHADPAAVLGHAMAHELGHLLLPYGSHARAGLMRGRWLTGDFKALAVGRLLFSPAEGALMRERIQSSNDTIGR